MKARLLAVLALLPAAGGAQLVTSAAALGPSAIVDISSRGGAGYNFTMGPVALPGGVTFTAAPVGPNNPAGSVFGQGSYALGTNGDWTAGGFIYAGLDAPAGTFRFTFSSPLTGVGAFMNYRGGATNVFLRALGAGGVLLEEHNVSTEAPIATPATSNGGAFRGIVRGAGDIVALEFANSFVAATDITYATRVAAVPEPATVALTAGALALLGLVARRRRA